MTVTTDAVLEAFAGALNRRWPDTAFRVGATESTRTSVGAGDDHSDRQRAFSTRIVWTDGPTQSDVGELIDDVAELGPVLFTRRASKTLRLTVALHALLVRTSDSLTRSLDDVAPSTATVGDLADAAWAQAAKSGAALVDYDLEELSIWQKERGVNAMLVSAGTAPWPGFESDASAFPSMRKRPPEPPDTDPTEPVTPNPFDVDHHNIAALITERWPRIECSLTTRKSAHWYSHDGVVELVASTSIAEFTWTDGPPVDELAAAFAAIQEGLAAMTWSRSFSTTFIMRYLIDWMATTGRPARDAPADLEIFGHASTPGQRPDPERDTLAAIAVQLCDVNRSDSVHWLDHLSLDGLRALAYEGGPAR